MKYWPLLILLFIYSTTPQCTSSQFNANGVCGDCHVTCLTCFSSTSTSCLTCASHRFKTSQNSCQCNDGLVERNPVVDQCDTLTCNFRCKTCNITTTTCTSCESTHFRVLVSSSATCPCIDKYFDNSVSTCAQCHYSCGKCTAGSTASECTFCATTVFRTLTSGQCLCDAGYYDDGTNYLCATCNYKCATCATSPTNCDTCGNNRGSAPACLCSDKFYDDGLSRSCPACHYSCKTCAVGTACTSCQATKFRIASSLTLLCSCMPRYFDSGSSSQTCTACDSRCVSCISATVCLTCNATAFRQYNSASKLCDCRIKYYQTSATVELCEACNSRCLTCSAAATNCTSCDSSLNRELSGNQCICRQGFFQNSFQTCSACQSSCRACTNATACTACVTSSLKVINSSNLCSCDATKWLNTTVDICQPCNYRCATCNISTPTQCLTCPASSFRTLSNFLCPCNLHYYDNGVATCAACHYSCLTCSSGTSSTCLTCKAAAHRTFLTNQCRCNTYYYDDGSLELCQPCRYDCLTCTDANTCTSCDITLFRVLATTAPIVCNCKQYYFQNIARECKLCLWSCHTCNSLTTCLTCDSATNKRVFNTTSQQCDCSPGFYDNFVDRTCLACLPQCLTCTNSTTCVTCDPARFRNLTTNKRCPCIQSYFDVGGICTPCQYHCNSCTSPTTCATCNSTAKRILSTSFQCICTANFFDNNVEQCAACSYACLTCVTTAQKCLTCDTTLRSLASNWCQCPQRFYDNNATVACVKCHYSCSVCRNASHCHTCNATRFRQFDSINKYCKCMDGYFDDNTTQTCVACNFRCATCLNSTHCLTCNSASFRFTPNSLCPCLDGYFDNGINQICPSCHYTCATCTNVSVCTTCEQTTNKRVFNNANFLCKCQDRFFDDGSNQQCLACVYSCLTCVSSTSNCTSCTDSANRVLTSNTCPCKQRFYDNLVQVCLACHYTCLTCTRAGSCDTCSAANNRQMNVASGLCACQIRFWDDGSAQKCNNCHASCLTCTGTTSCVTCDTTINRMLNNTMDIYNVASPFCVCFYRHFSTNLSAPCLPCLYSCQVCAVTANQCVYCNATSLRTFNATSKSCPCNHGFFDNGLIQHCQPCHSFCTRCTTALPNSCSMCSPIHFHLVATTTCYVICPDYFFDQLINMTCQSCSTGCLKCLNNTYCSKCQANKFLYNNTCFTTCPQGTYTDTANSICVNCPTGCKSCPDSTRCFSCIPKHYYAASVQFCLTCHQACHTCSGPGINQCLSCASPLRLRSNTCLVMSCPSGTYVHPQNGCLTCSTLFQGAATCNATRPFSCSNQYRLIGQTCVFCDNVPGYKMIQGNCGQICGDGLRFTLQCDDGNTLNGDGCSSNCMIQRGWTCTAASPSVCTLRSALSLTFGKVQKQGGSNSIIFPIVISLPIRARTNGFTASIAGISSNEYSLKVEQDQNNLTNVVAIVDYKVNLQGRDLVVTYTQSRRLQQYSIAIQGNQGDQPDRGYSSQNIRIQSKEDQKRDDRSNNRVQSTQDVSSQSSYRVSNSQDARVSSSAFVGSTSSSLSIGTFPPTIFHPDTTLQSYTLLQRYLTALSISLLVLSFIIIPNKTHLHGLTTVHIPAQIFICFGIAASENTQWIKFCVKYMGRAAMMGGFSMGQCCQKVSQYMEITSQVAYTAGIALAVLVFIIIMVVVVGCIEKFCCRTSSWIKKVAYFSFTIGLAIFLPLLYATTLALRHYTLLSATDSFNIQVSIALSMIFLAVVVLLWMATYNSQGARQLSSKDQKIQIEQKQDVMEIQEDSSDFTSKRGEIKSNQEINQVDKQQKQQLQVYQNKGYLVYDYIDLYNNWKTGYYNQEKAHLPTKAKYFLPALITKLYLIGVSAALMQTVPFYFFAVVCFIQLVFLIFLIVVRPFISTFSNFRLILNSFMMLGASGVMTVYLWYATTSNYQQIYENITVYLLLALISVAILTTLIQHLLAWKQQIWRCLQPCLKGNRIMGTRRMAQLQYSNSSEGMGHTVMSSTKRNFKDVDKDTQGIEMDAFYARMLKKDQLNKQYRKQRHL